jgi:hypothetical protein
MALVRYQWKVALKRVVEPPEISSAAVWLVDSQDGPSSFHLVCQMQRCALLKGQYLVQDERK